MDKKSTCLGCKLANRELPVNVVYEDEYIICILDHEPFNDGHTLILPKHHFLDVDEFDVKTSNSVMKGSILISKAIKLVFNPDGITICQNGGIFNDLTHYHMHVIPRYKGQFFGDFYLENETFSKKPQSYFEKIVIDIREALEIIKNKSKF